MYKIKHLYPDQVRRLFAQITDPRDLALFATIYHYGLRVSETTLIKMDDIDLDRGAIVISRKKNGRGGLRPLLANTATLIRRYLPVRRSTGDALFTSRQGNLSVSRIQKLFKAYARAAGLHGYSVHSFRHSIATHLYEAGFDLGEIQDHLGHVNIQSTQLYAHMTTRRRKAFFGRMATSRDVVTIK